LKLNRDNSLELFIRIPIGTALSEELIFRGSLMGVLLQYYSHTAALIVSSVIFGFWHVMPNPIESWAHSQIAPKKWPPRNAKLLSGGLTVASTAVGGLLFGGLRLIGGNILLPWASHTATNSIGWAANRPAAGGKATS
jgi:membrane protease YdiL (CAAX protease family)